MKTILVLILTAALYAQAQTTRSARPKVAVVAFENLTRSREKIIIGNPALTPSRVPVLGSDSANYYKVDMGLEVERYGETARSLLEVALVARPEIEVLERSRVALIQRELDLNRTRGGRRFLDEQGARLHGADFLVIGEIVGAWSESTKYDGYDVSLKTDATSAQICIRVVKLASETVVFAFERTGVVYEYTTPFVHPSPRDQIETAIRQAILEMVRDPHFIEAFIEKVRQVDMPQVSSVVGNEVSFATEGASVELDGRYVGVAPFKRLLNPAIEYRVRLTKPGFLPWESRICSESNLIVGPGLEPVPGKLSPSTNSTIK